MEFKELPYRYRTYSEEREWGEGNAIEYYRQSKEFRLYLEAVLCANYKAYISQENAIAANLCDSILRSLRGTGVDVS